ncbi:hypothetical protein F5883DRAFT_528406 [Diaporthe sp. PMI_573]|nr:hypothetical protein F5883DRAFT_528406 [Diaporthaceae sp. PMI_573]
MNKADCDRDELEKTLKENETGQQVPHGVPREGEDDDDAASSPDSNEEPTNYFYRNKTNDESDDKSSLVGPGKGADAESDCNGRFYLEGGKWMKHYNVQDSRKLDRNRQYDLQKYKCKVHIERAVLLAKLACIGGSASVRATPPDDKLDTRFAP